MQKGEPMEHLIVHCKDNNGVGDCPYRRFCFASMNDPTITGCGLPFVTVGMIPKELMMVEHTAKVNKDG